MYAIGQRFEAALGNPGQERQQERYRAHARAPRTTSTACHRLDRTPRRLAESQHAPPQHRRSHGRNPPAPRPRHGLCPARPASGSVVRRLLSCFGPAAGDPSTARADGGLHGAGRSARDRQAAGLQRRARPRPAQCRRGAPHRLRHERAGDRPDRPDPAGRHRPGPRPSARDPRPARPDAPHHQVGRAHPQPAGGADAGQPRRSGTPPRAGRGPSRWNARSTPGPSAARW